MRDDFQPCVYLLSSGRHGTLYIGVTSNLLARIVQHRDGTFPGFTKRYGVHRLVWYAVADTMDAAILREKQLKVEPRLEVSTDRGGKSRVGRSRDRLGVAPSCHSRKGVRDG